MMESDYTLALLLQQQFEHEERVENPTNGLVYNRKQESTNNDQRCLIDPSWEVIDPTPDIHVLFMTFDKKFFWNNLNTVCVVWSKRMTTCAGICSYEGQAGLCKISLSEPLLKLRPRKDLVETLLHEMIHAYLFVTNNNRDRDGHGPEFLKHMYRINKEAGTKITVYHDFHKEVHLYKRHWWKCNGPCQNRRPYFGLVGRAINRAPGPHDRWWTEHAQSCGGTFMKQEDKKLQTETTQNADKLIKAVPKNDIRNFFPVQPNGENSNVNIKNISTAIGQQATRWNKANDSNIHGFYTIRESSNILKNSNTNRNAVNIKAIHRKGFSNTRSNANSTIVVQKPKTNSVSRNSSVTNINSVNLILAGDKPSKDIHISSKNNDDDYSVVRAHWLSKFNTNDGQTAVNNKRPCQKDVDESSKCKRVGVDLNIGFLNDESENINTGFNDEADNIDYQSNNNVAHATLYCSCPICNKLILKTDINLHLDVCLTLSDHDENKEKCAAITPFECDGKQEFTDNGSANLSKIKLATCPVCSKNFTKAEIYVHVDMCLKGDVGFHSA